jgi:thiamine biosynthesis lipoprotein
MKKLIIFIALAATIMGCSSEPEYFLVKTSGPTQGTSYNISYIEKDGKDYREAIDSVLLVIDRSMSLWLNSSTIYKLNAGDSVQLDYHFKKVLSASLAISKETNGAFDVTIAPLVKAWGFGPDKRLQLDSAKVDSLLALVGYTKLRFDGKNLTLPKGMQLDMNAIAQGYSVDVLSDFLESKGITNYLVEVGGEVRARGKNASEKTWSVGVDKPNENLNPENRFQVIVSLDSAALATSGNYRKFWVDEATGIKYAHTINPKTGYPVKSQLLSATVIASDCMTADAWATACMVVGEEEAKKFIEHNKDLEAYFVSSDFEGNYIVWQSKGFAKIAK